eukprot:534390-Prymnesium_polylepis.1
MSGGPAERRGAIATPLRQVGGHKWNSATSHQSSAISTSRRNRQMVSHLPCPLCRRLRRPRRPPRQHHSSRVPQPRCRLAGAKPAYRTASESVA